MVQVAVIGGAGQLGSALLPRLVARRIDTVVIGRDESRLRRLGVDLPFRPADLADIPAARAALADAEVVVSCANARYVDALIAALPGRVRRVVVMGSARRFTRFPDAAAEAVRAAEASFVAAGLPGVMLHPTMIYGGNGENNVRRIAAYIRRFRALPLPAGGRSLIQMIHVDDAAACLEAALFGAAAIGPPIVIAGPTAISYRDMVRSIARAIDRPVHILPAPAWLLIGATRLIARIPGLPPIGPDEVRRLLEDKAFDIGPMRRRLGIEPMPFEIGLARLFGPPH